MATKAPRITKHSPLSILLVCCPMSAMLCTAPLTMAVLQSDSLFLARHQTIYEIVVSITKTNVFNIFWVFYFNLILVRVTF